MCISDFQDRSEGFTQIRTGAGRGTSVEGLFGIQVQGFWCLGLTFRARRVKGFVLGRSSETLAYEAPNILNYTMQQA